MIGKLCVPRGFHFLVKDILFNKNLQNNELELACATNVVGYLGECRVSTRFPGRVLKNLLVGYKISKTTNHEMGIPLCIKI